MEDCALITFLDNFSENNFDKNYTDNRQRTILHQAASNGDVGVIKGLLIDHVDANVLDKDQCTPLCLAIRQERYEAAEFLIDGDVDINRGGGIFGSPMHLAIIRMKISIIEKLLYKGVDLNKEDTNGDSPTHLVVNIFSKNPDRCAYILNQMVIHRARVNQKNYDRWAPIHSAVRKGQEMAVRAIISINKKHRDPFSIDIPGGTYAWTPLHLAAMSS